MNIPNLFFTFIYAYIYVVILESALFHKTFFIWKCRFFLLPLLYLYEGRNSILIFYHATYHQCPSFLYIHPSVECHLRGVFFCNM